MYDGSKLATIGWTSAAVATRTSPAPDRSAAAPHSAAAPAIPRLPASTSTVPYRPLWLSRGRGREFRDRVDHSSVMKKTSFRRFDRQRPSIRNQACDLADDPEPTTGPDSRPHAAWPIRRAISPAMWPPLKPASMFTTTTFDAQLLSIPEQCRDSLEVGPVADAGRHGDDRAVDQPADDAGQRALHPGDDDQGIGVLELGELVQQAVQSGNSDVGDELDLAVPRLGRDPASSATGKSLVPAVTITTRPSLGSPLPGADLESTTEGVVLALGEGGDQVDGGLGIDPR